MADQQDLNPQPWRWHRLFIDRRGDPDEQIIFATLGTLGVWFLVGWMLYHGEPVTLDGFATAQAALWAAAGLGKMTSNMNGGP